MASITGAMTTTNVLSDQLAIDLGDRISLLEPSAQPLAVFTRKANKKRTVATKFSWLEDASKPRFDTQNGGATNVATTVAVTNGAYFQQRRAVPRRCRRLQQPHGHPRHRFHQPRDAQR